MRAFRTALFLLMLPCLSTLPGASAPPDRGDPATTVAELRRLLPAEVAGWRESGKDRVFTRDTVSEYAGDSTEILLGFPFRLLLVREYRKEPGGDTLSAEIHDMSTSADAFGIFSHGPGGERLDVGQEAFFDGADLRFWKGNIFVRLKGGDKTAETKSVLVGLGLRISAAITRVGARPRILSCLPSESQDRASARYFHKQVSLDPHYYLADRSVLLLDETTDVALAAYPSTGRETLVLLIRYAAPQDADKAFRRFGGDYFSAKIEISTRRIVEKIETGGVAAALRAGEFLLLVLEAPDKAAAEALLRSAESRIVEVFGRRRGDTDL